MPGPKLLLLAVLIAAAAAASPAIFDFNLPLLGVSLEYFSIFSSSVLSLWGSLVRNLNPVAAVSVALACYVVVKLWRLLFVPIRLIRRLEDAGYIPDGKDNIKEISNSIRRAKDAGDLPPVFPNGWFEVLGSQDLKIGEVKNACCLGENFAVFRGEDGVVSILDAYCPHLGANLGVGGQVVGNCLQCPFHGWKFRGDDGKCTEIPYSKTVPEYAKVKSWPCLERNGSIMVWYHAEGTEPGYLPEEIEQITDGGWTYRGITEHRINSHIEEIPENAADMNHFNFLHGSPILAGQDLRYSFTSKWIDYFHHAWSATWTPLEGKDKHISELKMLHQAFVLGYRVPFLDFHLEAKQIGPGLVHMHFHSRFGDGVMCHTLTPLEPMIQRMIHRIYGDNFLLTCIAKSFLLAESIQVERDIMIWNHKKYLLKPMLMKEDHLISKHRRWYSQFYSENSPRFNGKTNNMNNNKLDW